MPRNGSGSYSLPAGNPVTSGTLIEASWANTTLSDLASAMTDSLARSGEGGMTGPLRATDGSVSVPSLSFGNETSTGFYRAGATNVRFAMAGVDVATITPTGVGIGTSSPGAKLDVGYVAGNVALRVSRDANNRLDFYQGAGVSYIDSSPAGGQIAFSTAGAERMRLDTSGNLGIGTSSPARRFHTSTGSAAGVALFESTLGTTAAIGLKNTGSSANYPQLLSVNDDMGFQTSGSERMRLDASGNLGLGVTPSASNPQYFKTFELGKPGSGLVAATLSLTASELTWLTNNSYVEYSAGAVWKYASNGAAVRYGLEDNAHVWYTAPSGTAGNAISFTQAMTLDASGNLGIGVTSPGTRLDLDSSGSRVIDINSTNVSGSGIRFKNSSTINGYVGSAKYIVAGGALADFGIDVTGANNLIFGTNDTERARITSGGDFLVGTTDGSFNAGVGHKFSAIGTSGQVVNISNGNTYHLFNENATNNGYRFYVAVNGGVINYSGNNVNLSDERTKTNIELAGSYLQKMCAIPVKLFNYKDEAEGEQKTLGVIAQDVEAVAPEFVNNDGWEGTDPEDGVPLKTIYSTDMMYGLMKALQELKAELDTAKARIEALEAAA